MSTKLTHLKDQAILMRRDGYSYGQIKKSLELRSKGTLSSWLKNITLSKKSERKLLKNNKLAIKRGLFNFNKNRTKKIQTENQITIKNGVKSIPKLNKKDLMLIGTALYWAEGTKSWTKNANSKFSFANSDPNMIKVCMRFLREILIVDEAKIIGGIHLYQDTNIANAKNFWSRTTGLPIEKFYIINQVSRAGQNLRKTILPYGTIHIRVNGRLIFFKVKGFIDGMIKKLDK